FIPILFWHGLGTKKIDPKLAVAHSNHHVLGGEPKGAQKIHTKREQFHVRVERFLADDVGIELEVFAKTAALLLLITETLRDRKPLERLFEFSVMRRDHARQSRSEFG